MIRYYKKKTHFAPSENVITPNPLHNPFKNAPSYRVPSIKILKNWFEKKTIDKIS